MNKIQRYLQATGSFTVHPTGKHVPFYLPRFMSEMIGITKNDYFYNSPHLFISLIFQKIARLLYGRTSKKKSSSDEKFYAGSVHVEGRETN